MDALATTLFWLDFAAAAVFGATGALAAARRRHDIITFGFFAAVTGVGGGTLRDLLIGAPVFWVARPGYIIACLAAAAAIWIVGRKPWRFTALLWLDALGMAAYTVVGTAKALSFGAPPISAVVMGVLTAAFGGIVRDVLAGEPSILLRREIYITAALAGSSVFVILTSLGVPYGWAGGAGFATALVIRSGALLLGWKMPAFPGSPTED
ncbi:trimeric intracellular cation channel family protein [Caulobacter sp. NIBR2454]|uniref:trimeric intracellular cation channel family protein n=1 Tax=Caulobacter sp. NIBR2454 TaxID=3015996 RepID=UPI0022B74DC4|nr:trimeric intracellular cation channel family protein [Caulobacter sp. NIBR2454]